MPEAAEALGREAVALAEETDCLDLRAGSQVVLAELLLEAGDERRRFGQRERRVGAARAQGKHRRDAVLMSARGSAS